MLRTAVRHILLLIPLLCCTLLADGQVLDSAAEARIKDTVDRYYRLHPRRHPSHRPSEFRVMPLFGAMYTQETEFLAMGGFMGSGRTSEDTLAPPSTVGAVLMISTNLSAAGAITGPRTFTVPGISGGWGMRRPPWTATAAVWSATGPGPVQTCFIEEAVC